MVDPASTAAKLAGGPVARWGVAAGEAFPFFAVNFPGCSVGPQMVAVALLVPAEGVLGDGGGRTFGGFDGFEAFRLLFPGGLPVQEVIHVIVAVKLFEQGFVDLVAGFLGRGFLAEEALHEISRGFRGS